MKNSSPQKSRRNAKISVSVRLPLMQKRKKLIFFVTEKSYSIGKAAARLKLKLSTAKMIVKRYKDEGTFFEPKLFELKRSRTGCEKRRDEEVNASVGEEPGVKMEEMQSENSIVEVKVE